MTVPLPPGVTRAAKPRTIVYCGNFTRKFCTEVHVAGSLEALGHTVIRLQENRTAWDPDVLTAVVKHQADMVLWTRTWPAEMEKVKPVLDRLADLDIPTVSYHLDRWFGLDRAHQVDDQPFFHTSLVISPDDSPEWAVHGIEHWWAPPGVYHAECGPVAPDRRRYPWDVVFVGSYPYPHPEWAPYREELIGTFEARFGDRFKVLPPKGVPLRGAELQTLYATVPVILGDSCLAGETHRYWSDRIPETLGRGGLLIHPEIDGQVGKNGEWYVDAEHLLTYPLGDFEDAAMQAALVMEKPSLASPISRPGRDLVLGRDTYCHRMQSLLAEVGHRNGWDDTDKAPPPVTVSGGFVSGYIAVNPAPRTIPARLGRWRATFEDDGTDQPGNVADVVREVWSANDYRIDRPLSGTVLDIGANVGAFTVLAAVAGAEKVVAFEPDPTNRARLERHLMLNRVADRVVVEAAAVSCDPGRTVMTGAGGGAHLLYGDETRDDVRVVDSVGLRQVIEGNAPVSLLKCDIEGGEYEAFEGVTAHLLDEHVERIALEFHGPGMPHLAALNSSGGHLDRWKALVALLADCGSVEIRGHPSMGGLIHWRRF